MFLTQYFPISKLLFIENKKITNSCNEFEKKNYSHIWYNLISNIYLYGIEV